MPLGKRKIGCDDVSSEVDAIQELMTDMELACNEQDHVAVERIYERYLARFSVLTLEAQVLKSTACRMLEMGRL